MSTTPARSEAEVSPLALRIALGFYLVILGFCFYSVRSLGAFLAQAVLPENVNGFSVANPRFNLWNTSASAVIALVLTALLFLNGRLREYMVDVGDELTLR